MARRFKNFIIGFLQQSWLQGFYERLLKISLRGMNFGGGSDLYVSGEAHALNFVKNKLSAKSEIVVFDVGANVGEFSKLAEDTFKNQKLKIFAFEPAEKTFAALEKNLRQFQNISLIKKAVGDSKSQLNLFSVSGESGLASVYNRNLEFVGKQTDSSESVEQTTLDDFCQENNIANIDYLKLDIEGHELAALKGAEQLIRNGKVSFLQFEFGGANIDSRTYFKDFFYLLKPQYNLYRILSHGLQKVEKYKESHEIFITTNYLAVLKHYA